MARDRALRIYIPTRGRINKQTTLNALTPELRKRTTLVVDYNEAHLYAGSEDAFVRDCLLMVLPPKLKGIAWVRQYVMDNSEHDFICMLDDDLTFNTKDKDKKIRAANAAQTNYMFDQLGRWLQSGEVVHCGITPRFLNWQDDPAVTPYKENTRMMHVLAYNRPAVNKSGAKFTNDVKPDFSMDDFHMTLQLLRRGLGNRLDLANCISVGTANAEGGASEWRTLESHNKSAQTLGKNHAGFVTVKEKHAWQGMEGSRFDVVVQWGKAFRAADLA